MTLCHRHGAVVVRNLEIVMLRWMPAARPGARVLAAPRAVSGGLAAVAVGLLGAGGLLLASSTAAAAATTVPTYTVTIGSKGLTPTSLDIPAGSHVVFHNATSWVYQVAVASYSQPVAPTTDSPAWTAVAGTWKATASGAPVAPNYAMTITVYTTTSTSPTPAPSASSPAPSGGGSSGSSSPAGQAPQVAPAPKHARSTHHSSGGAAPVATAFPAAPPPFPALPLPAGNVTGAAPLGGAAPLLAPPSASSGASVSGAPAATHGHAVSGLAEPASSRGAGLAAAVAAVLVAGVMAAQVRTLLAEPAGR